MTEIADMLQQLEGCESDWVSQLMQWAEINSGSTHQEGLFHMLEELECSFAHLGALASRLPPAPGALAPSLSLRCRPEAPVQVLLSGHYDTVFGKDHPFQHCTLAEGGLLCGPGVTDMKGGLLVMLMALEAFETLSFSKNLGWEVLLNSDEEEGSQGSRQHLLEAARRHHLGLVFEPSPAGDHIVASRKGTACLQVSARGQAAHSSLAKTEGRNAVVALSELLVEAHALNHRHEEVIVNVANVAGGGPVNVVPDLAKAELHLRCGVREQGERALAELRELANAIAGRRGVEFALEGGFNRPPMAAQSAVVPWVERLQACGRELGQEIRAQAVPSASDANFLAAAGLPTIDGLGVDGDGLHSDQEHCLVSSLGRRIRLVSLFLARLALSQPRPSSQDTLST